MKNMRVQLLPFGVLKDALSPGPLEIPAAATVGDLLAVLGEQLRESPSATLLLPRIAVSVNAEYAQLGQILHEGDHVGLLPPVSGGCAAATQPIATWLTREAIAADELVAAIRDIHPRAPTHILIVPNKLIPTANDVTSADEALLGHMFVVAAQLAAREGIAKDGYRLIVNCNEHGGQEVYHLHLHLLGGRPLGPMLTE